MCLCAVKSATLFQTLIVTLCTVLFGNILIAIFLIYCYRRYSSDNIGRILSTRTTDTTSFKSDQNLSE